MTNEIATQCTYWTTEFQWLAQLGYFAVWVPCDPTHLNVERNENENENDKMTRPIHSVNPTHSFGQHRTQAEPIYSIQSTTMMQRPQYRRASNERILMEFVSAPRTRMRKTLNKLKTALKCRIRFYLSSLLLCHTPQTRTHTHASATVYYSPWARSSGRHPLLTCIRYVAATLRHRPKIESCYKWSRRKQPLCFSTFRRSIQRKSFRFDSIHSNGYFFCFSNLQNANRKFTALTHTHTHIKNTVRNPSIDECFHNFFFLVHSKPMRKFSHRNSNSYLGVAVKLK